MLHHNGLPCNAHSADLSAHGLGCTCMVDIPEAEHEDCHSQIPHAGPCRHLRALLAISTGTCICQSIKSAPRKGQLKLTGRLQVRLQLPGVPPPA